MSGLSKQIQKEILIRTMTNKIKPRIILNRCLTDYYTYFFLLPIIYISGCEGDQGPADSAGGVTELIVNVQNKM